MATKGAELAAIVGPEHVLDDPVVLERFARDASFTKPLKPWFVAQPSNAEQVRGLVQWAMRTRTPLVPVSSGGPRQYGDTVPSAPEAVMVDLSQMKTIKRIDRRNRIAVIEPGVTYAELMSALAMQGLQIPHPLQPRTTKSVVASLLERQPTLIPRLNFSLPEPLRNCGVVWGTGEIAFTGEAGNGPLSLDEQWAGGLSQIAAWGPSATDLMRLVTGAQGTMGIVVWASVKLEIKPALRKFFAIPAADIAELVDLVYKLTKVRLGDEVLILNRALLAGLVEREPARRAALLNVLPEWTLLIGLAGTALLPVERLKVQEKELRGLVKDSLLILRDGYSGVGQSEFSSIVDGFQSVDDLMHRDIFFLSTLDKVPGHVANVQAIAARQNYPLSEIGIYVQPQHQGVSHHVEFRLPFDPADKKRAQNVEEVYRSASEALIENGAYFSRPYGYWSELVYARDHTSTDILKTVKGILDPENILNPGKLCF